MTQPWIRALAALLLLGSALACGKYGPPERLPVAPPAGQSAAPPVSAAPPSSEEPAKGESCEEKP